MRALTLGTALRARLIAYNGRNAPGAFGRHSYTLEEYGLSEAAVDAAFADYLGRFGRG